MTQSSPRYGIKAYDGRRLVSIALWIFALITLVPELLIVIAALTPGQDLITGFALPGHLTFANIRRAWDEGGFARHLEVSTIVTCAITALSTVCSILAGYALAILRPPGRGLIASVFLLGLAVPYEALIIPLYYKLRTLGLTDTYWSLILPQSGLSLSFGVYWMRGFFRGVPPSLIEGARIDGASSIGVLGHFLVPLARPAILTLIVLTFVWNWNEFLLPLVMISSAGKEPAPVALSTFQGQMSSDVTALAAGALIISLPMVLLYVALQRRFMDGVLTGAVKG